MMRIIQQQLDKNRQLREEQNRKWEENQRQWLELKRESDKRWEENQHQWEANQQIINQMLESIHKLDNKYDQTIGTLSTRWGLHYIINYL